MAQIEIKQLRFRYPLTDFYALDGICLGIEKGDFLAIIGKNGAGKTTLCHAIRGLIPHFQKGDFEGEITIDGGNIGEKDLGNLATTVGLVFQNPFIQVSGIKQTVYEEIVFGLENLGVPRSEMIRRADDIMNQLKIGHLKDKNPIHLSGGQRQRVAIASVLVMQPEILILDEPTSQLDPIGTQEVLEVIALLKEKKITIVLVEQKRNVIAEYADKVVVMDQGRIVLQGSVKEVLTNPEIENYGCALPEVTDFSYELIKRTGISLKDIPIRLQEAKQIFSNMRIQSGRGGAE